MKIIYMHHAERKKNNNYAWGSKERENDGITKTGIKEAKLISKQCKKLNIKAIITSPYLRCKLTAEIINKYHNLQIIEDERFNEIQKGEEWKKCLKRNMKAIDDIVKNYDDEDTIICISSGVNISAFICYFYNIEPTNEVSWTQAGTISPIIFNLKK